ncbi:MAG TPA: glycosyltransferase family 1 protein [Tepidisphaeraceae bacterium]|nr:glycosyltransferase family 1 protein [Tepidisphaeraceae bacterium]
MRIGINAFPLRADGGGARFVFTGLLGALLRLDSSHRYLIFTHFEGLRLVYQVLAAHGETPGNGPDARVRVIQIADEGRIYAHRHDFDLYFGPLNNLNPRIYDRPTVGMLLDIQEQYFPEYFSKAELVARNELYPEICRCATLVLTISEFCKQTFVDKFGINPEKIEVVYLAPQPALVNRDAMDAGRWSHDPLPPDFLFYPANCYKHKNHQLLLDALVKLRDAGRCPPMVFSGYELPGGFQLRKEIAERGLGDFCRHYTELPVDELRYLYRNALAAVLPTMFEGFCIPAVEAMACGCPVVCSDLPVLHEVVGDNAIYFNPTDADDLVRAIEKVRDDATLRQSMRERGLAAAGRFNWDASGRQLLDIFRRARERFAWGGHLPGTVKRPKIGVLLRLPRLGQRIGATIESLLVTGYSDLALRCIAPADLPDDKRKFLVSAGVEMIQSDPAAAGGEELLAFARDAQLDLVGETLEGNRFKPSAFDSLAWAYLEDSARAVYLGEAFDSRGEQFTGIARMRLTGDQLWKLDGFLYPELVFLNPHALSQWPRGIERATQGGQEWRWELLREARSTGRLFMTRRTLADCDRASLPAGAGKQAARAGMFDYYSAATENVARVRLLRRGEGAIKRAARLLPMKWQDRGTRLWYYVAR